MLSSNPGPAWLESPENLVLSRDEVHIWRADLEMPESRIRLLKSFLSEDERSRSERLRFSQDRFRFIAARGILRMTLSRYLRVSPEQLCFSYNEYGKPFLLNSEAQEISFNVSHSGRTALYAFSSRRSVGIDIELIRSNVDCLLIAEHFFAPGESQALRSLPLNQQVEAFYRCWTRKEAYIKATGQGLSQSIQDFEVSLGPEENSTIRPVRGPGHWSIFHLVPFTGYVAALAAEGRPYLRCWNFC